MLRVQCLMETPQIPDAKDIIAQDRAKVVQQQETG